MKPFKITFAKPSHAQHSQSLTMLSQAKPQVMEEASFFFNCKTNQSSLFSRIMNIKFWSNHKKYDNHICFTACIHSYSLASAEKRYQFIMKYLQKILLMFFGFSSRKINEVFKWIVTKPRSGSLKVKNQSWITDWQQYANWEKRVKRDFNEKVIINPSV